jgi:hypothetical protein
MSRTDKDIPWQFQSEWYQPIHGHNCIQLVPYLSRWGPRETTVPCTLPNEPQRRKYVPWYRLSRELQFAACTWEPVYERYDHRYRYTRPPTKRERHLGWDGPVRAQLRDLLFEARKQYRGSGDIDIPEPPRHHRHASIKGWWD